MYTPQVAEILSKPTCTVDEAKLVLGIGRNQAYVAVRSGEIPSLRIGNRILVPTKKLVAMFDGDSGEAA